MEAIFSLPLSTTRIISTKSPAPMELRKIMGNDIISTRCSASSKGLTIAKTISIWIVSPASPITTASLQLRTLSFSFNLAEISPAAIPSRKVARPQGIQVNPPISIKILCPPAIKPAPIPTTGPPKSPAVMTAMALRFAIPPSTGTPT